MSNITTTVLKPMEAKRDIRTMIQSSAVRDQMAMVLPKHLTADRMARVACTTIMRVPKLAQCTPESLLNCLMQCSQLGLEPDGRRAHLIPFENRKNNTVECTLIIDWKGLAELALRSGSIAKLHADLICEKDEFSYDMGDILHHRIDFKQPRGEPYAAYAMAVTKTGEKFVQVMTRDEIEGVRDNSQGWRAFKAGYAKQSPWKDAPGEMWKKTVFRRLAKWLPLSPEYRDAIEIDDEPRAALGAVALPAILPALPAPVFEAPTPVLVEDEQAEAEAGLAPMLEKAVEAAAPPPKEAEVQAEPAPPGGNALPLRPDAANAPQAKLETFMSNAGVTFDQFRKWAADTERLEDADSYAGWPQLPTAFCQSLLRDVKSLNRCVTRCKS
jgi:recombination protein RecT